MYGEGVGRCFDQNVWLKEYNSPSKYYLSPYCMQIEGSHV